MFPLKLGDEATSLRKIVVEDKSWLWHLRYGHLNFQSLKVLTTKELGF